MSQSLLRVQGLTRKFGGLVAVRDLSFNVNQGEIVGLIGPNGAGKTTAFNLITGTIRPSSGRVQFQNEDITGGPPSKVVVAGLARTFQSTSTYPRETVAENVYRGLLSRISGSIVGILAGRRDRKSKRLNSS